MTLCLLIDTCVWLDLAKDKRHLPILEAVAALSDSGDLDLIMPRTVLDEFARNKERVIAENKRSLSGHFRAVREAAQQFAPEQQRQETLDRLNELDHLIAVRGKVSDEAVEVIEKLFAHANVVETTDAVKARAADRAIRKNAPCHGTKNGIADAVIIETYADALAAKPEGNHIYAFVTHNISDFSRQGGDSRIPHSDLEKMFDGLSSIYSTSLGSLLSEYAEDVVEDLRFQREYSEEPRKLQELLDAEEKLFRQVWYNRKWNIIARVESNDERLVSQAVYDAATPEERRSMMVNHVWEGMLAAMKKTEDELGPDNIGPWTDFEWGMLNGKLSAIRWMLGDEWDMLDT